MQEASTKTNDISALEALEIKARNALLTPRETRAILRCSHSHLYALIRKGLLRPIKLGRSTRIPVGQLDTLIGGEK
jgi:excisionase family DNA binding protein